MNIIIFFCLDLLIKNKIERNIVVNLSYCIIFFLVFELNYFKKEVKLVLIEIFEDVNVISFDDGDWIVGSIVNILIYKFLIKYIVILIILS